MFKKKAIENKNIKKILKTYFFLSFFFMSCAFANIKGDLDNFFDSILINKETKNINAYQGQRAGFYTGGNLFSCDAARKLKIAKIDLPSIRSGCGGIDIFSGGFSFINADQLIFLFKNIMNNAKGYAFTLAMESVTPQIANVMKYMNDLASKVNDLSIKSCEASAALVGSLWPKTQEAQRRICEDVGTKKGIFADYTAAKHGCAAGGELTSTLKAQDKSYESFMSKDSNLIWKAIQKIDFLQNDTELAELFLSLSGSIIIKTNGNNDDAVNNFSMLPSLADNASFLKSILHGGNISIYKCDDKNDCLNPKIINSVIEEESSLNFRVKKIIREILEKIRANQPLTKNSLSFLESTKLPIYKILYIQASYFQDQKILDITDYSEIIAIDILFQYLRENLSAIKLSSAIMQYPQHISEKLTAGIDNLLQSINSEKNNALSKNNLASNLIFEMQKLENDLLKKLAVKMLKKI